MPKDSYPSQKRALENYKKKTRTIFFSLNLKESEQANKLENANRFAKDCFLEKIKNEKCLYCNWFKDMEAPLPPSYEAEFPQCFGEQEKQLIKFCPLCGKKLE